MQLDLITLDTTRLGSPDSPVVLITLGEARSDVHQGSATRYLQMLAIAHEPVLLLKAETYYEEAFLPVTAGEAATSSAGQRQRALLMTF